MMASGTPSITWPKKGRSASSTQAPWLAWERPRARPVRAAKRRCRDPSERGTSAGCGGREARRWWTCVPLCSANTRPRSHRDGGWRGALDALNDFVGRFDLGVDLAHGAFRGRLHLGRPGGGRVIDDHDSKSAVGRVANGNFHAAAGDDSGNDQCADTEISEHVVEIGAVEDATARLAQDDLVSAGRHLLQDLSLSGTRRMMDTQTLVLQASVAPVTRERLDMRVDDLHTRAAERRQEPADTGNDECFEPVGVVLDGSTVATLDHAAQVSEVAMSIAVLHIDDQQRGLTHGEIGFRQALMAAADRLLVF